MLKKSLFFLCSITLVALAIVVVLTNNYNPYESSRLLFALFYLSILATLSGLFTISIFYIKVYVFKNSLIYALFLPSLRQGIIISAGFTMLLLLQGLRLLDAWVGIPLLIVIVLIELFFQTKK